MTERLLTDQEKDWIALSALVCHQADTMPKHLVESHGEILDRYLLNFPKQTHAILALIGKEEPVEWDD